MPLISRVMMGAKVLLWYIQYVLHFLIKADGRYYLSLQTKYDHVTFLFFRLQSYSRLQSHFLKNMECGLTQSIKCDTWEIILCPKKLRQLFMSASFKAILPPKASEFDDFAACRSAYGRNHLLFFFFLGFLLSFSLLIFLVFILINIAVFQHLPQKSLI